MLGADRLAPAVTILLQATASGCFTSEGEHFLSFAEFPWFRDASVGHILNVEEPSPGHYYWPDLEVDLSLKIIRNPAHYPLAAKAE